MKFIKFLSLYSLFIVHLLFFNASSAHGTHVIGSRSAGFFSDFLLALNHLIWCERNNITPIVYWDHNSLYYSPKGYHHATNAWEYYFEPVSTVPYNPKEIIHNGYSAPDNTTIITGKGNFTAHFLPEVRQEVYQLMQKYIHVKSVVQKKVDAFYKKHMEGKPTVGVHIRRTDNYISIHVGLEEYIKRLQDFPNHQILVCTDDYQALAYMKEKFGKRVIYCNVYRSHDGSPVHHHGKHSKPLLGEEILMEVLLLARCDLFVHAISNVVCGVLFFNPMIPNIFIDPRDYGIVSLE
ncbi:MAG: hypothetical protein WCE21_04875 [Candidatus Babeliales bacterium]